MASCLFFATAFLTVTNAFVRWVLAEYLHDVLFSMFIRPYREVHLNLCEVDSFLGVIYYHGSLSRVGQW